MVAAARVPGPADRIWRHCNASTTGVVNPGRGPASFRDPMGRNSLYGMGRWRPRVALVLAGCAVEPDYERPEVALPEAWPGAVGEQMDKDSADGEFWWERFEDPRLDRLVRDALENDLDAGIAAARVVQARAEWLPSLNLAALFGQEASGWRHASARCVPGSRSLTWRSGAISAGFRGLSGGAGRPSRPVGWEPDPDRGLARSAGGHRDAIPCAGWRLGQRGDPVGCAGRW